MQTVLQLSDRTPPELPGGFRYRLVEDGNTFEEVIRRINDASAVVDDVETTGVNPWEGDCVAGVALIIPPHKTAFYLPFRHGQGFNLPEEWLQGPLVKALSRPDLVHIGHNYKFDTTMQWLEGMEYPGIVEDTMLGAHLMNENEPSFKLERLAGRYTDKNGRAFLGQRWLNLVLTDHGLTKGDMWLLTPEQVAPYACYDVYLTHRLHRFYTKHLTRWKLEDMWRDIGFYGTLLSKLEWRGMQLDLERVEYLRDLSDRNAKAAERAIREVAGYPLNMESSKQLQAFLERPSTAIDVLNAIIESPAESPETRQRAQWIKEYRAWAKMRGSYYDAFLEYMDSAAVLHPNLFLCGTISGRLSCKQPNMQAIPRTVDPNEDELQSAVRRVKECFIARPGYVLVQADYSQAEIRLATHYTKDPTMIRLLTEEGADLHGETAAEMGIPRFAAKRLNFSAIYGIGAATLAVNLGISEEDAANYLQKYHAKRPGFRALYRRAELSAKTRGYIRMWTGRARHYNVPEAEHHKASSNLIQGGVGEVIRIAMSRLDREFSGSDVHQLLQVHDSTMLELPAESAGELLPEIKRVMEDFEFAVPMTVDIKVGQRWNELETWEEAA